jgi:hypothetical protein
MNKLAQDLTTQLARKDAIDINNQHANNMASYTRWVVDAIELLLRAELERQKHGDTPR